MKLKEDIAKKTEDDNYLNMDESRISYPRAG